MDTFKNRVIHIINTRENGNGSEFARKLGYSQSAINHYTKSNVDRIPKADLLAKMVEVYKLSDTWALRGIGPEDSKSINLKITKVVTPGLVDEMEIILNEAQVNINNTLDRVKSKLRD